MATKQITKPIGEYHEVTIWYNHSWHGSFSQTQYEGTDKLQAEKAWNKKINDGTTRKQYRIWEYNPFTDYSLKVVGVLPKKLHDEIVECKHGSIV